jgi:hypothetical protein
MATVEHPPEAKFPVSDAPAGLRFAALVLRTVFILALVVLTFHVSLPQNETILTAYDTPSDLVRLILGLAVCAWLLYQLFMVPKDAHGDWTWFYLGLVAVPFALICLVYTW